MATATRLPVAAYLAFAAFGGFWGAWGASVPRVQDRTGLTDGGLGVALLFVGAGALPAMLLTGRALDRFGLRVAGALIASIGLAGALLAVVATDLLTLSLALALVGATSGAADVAMNSVAGRAEQEAGRPVITRAHGVFSASVVAGTLLTGLAADLRLPVVVPFAVVAVAAAAAGALLTTMLPGRETTSAGAGSDSPLSARTTRLIPLVLVGVLGALAFASENAHQSWSAVFAHDELGTSQGLAAVAPAAFAATVAVTRLAIGGLSSAHARTVLLVGAATAPAGAAVVASSPSLPVAVLGLVLAAAGTAVLFPTLLGFVSRSVDESRRGSATSVVTTVSYLGFLLGPVYVGLWADALGLRGAMLAVSALGVALVLLAPVLLRLSGFDVRVSAARSS